MYSKNKYSSDIVLSGNINFPLTKETTKKHIVSFILPSNP